MESTLGDLLHQALGEGDDAGSVNFKTLKFIIASILGQLGIEQNLPPHLPPSDSKLVDFQSRFHELGLGHKLAFRIPSYHFKNRKFTFWPKILS
jgi:hypothetical protein